MKIISIIYLVLGFAFANYVYAQESDNIVRDVIRDLDNHQIVKKHVEITRDNQKISKNSPINTGIAARIGDSDKKVETFDSISSDAYGAVTLGRLEAAIALYNKALEKKPDDVETLYSLGVLHHKLRAYQKASDYYIRVLKIKPAHHLSLSNYLALLASEDTDRALRELHELEKINHDFAPILGQIGIIYAKRGQYDNAEQYILRAIRLNPAEMQYWYNLAVMYDKCGKKHAARNLYYDILLKVRKGESVSPVPQEYLKKRIEDLTFNN